MARLPPSLVVPRKNKPVPIDPTRAAAEILGFLAADEDRLHRFFELTGLAPRTLREAATQPGFVESVVEYLCADDRLLMAFAAERGHDPAAIDAMRQRLHHRDNEAD